MEVSGGAVPDPLGPAARHQHSAKERERGPHPVQPGRHIVGAASRGLRGALQPQLPAEDGDCEVLAQPQGTLQDRGRVLGRVILRIPSPPKL